MNRKTPFVALLALVLAMVLVPSRALAAEVKPMYRLYNQWTYEHFYTSDIVERNSLVGQGWTYESIGWFAPTTGDPVYRLYNKYAPGGDHHYTMDKSEYDHLVSVGWTGEGIGWYSDSALAVPVYREYNPYEKAHNHNYTPHEDEHDHLVSLGWLDEGIGWYGAQAPSGFYDTPVPISSVTVTNVPTSLIGGSEFQAQGRIRTGFGVGRLVSQAWFDYDDETGRFNPYSNPEDGANGTLPEAGIELNYVLAIQFQPSCMPEEQITVVIDGKEYTGILLYDGEFPDGQAFVFLTDYVVTTS